MRLRNRVRTIGQFVLLALLAGWLHGLAGFASPRPEQARLPSGFLFNYLPVFSDFDGDNKVDQATVSSDGSFKHIYITLGKSSRSLLSFSSNEPGCGRLVSGDIDDDGDIDLVWVSQSAQKFVTWLGDGRGNFTIGTDPKLNLERIQTLLGNGSPQVRNGADTAALLAVLSGYSFVIPVGSADVPDPATQESPLLTSPSTFMTPGSFVHTQRGPPSQTF